MPGAKPAELDQVIWADYVKLRSQAEVGELHGIPQQRVSDAVRRYLDSVPEPERREFRIRTLDRYERVYQAWKDKADTSTRAANVVIRTLALQARLLGLEPKELHIDGKVEHDHTVEHEPTPTLAEVLEDWRQRGIIRPQAEITRLDGGG